MSVFDHGLLYGDGVFEGMRSYAGKVFRLDAHLDRLWASARAICLEIPLSKEAMAKAVDRHAGRQQPRRRLRAAGRHPRGRHPRPRSQPRRSNPQVIVIADTISLYPAEFYEKGLRIVTAATQRTQSAALSPRIKSLNYLNNIMAKLEGLQAGCVEALMLNHKGEVAECTGDNVFVVRVGRLLTPPPDAGILEGITRNAVMELARAAGIDCREADAHAARPLHRRRVLPDRHRRRGDPGRRDRRPHDRRRHARPGHQAAHRRLPRPRPPAELTASGARPLRARISAELTSAGARSLRARIGRADLTQARGKPVPSRGTLAPASCLRVAR